MPARDESHVIQLPTTRALEERKARSEFTSAEYDRFLSLIPDLSLEGGKFDEVSWAYPLEIPKSLRVTVLEENPRVVSVGLRDGRGRFVGVVGEEALERACVNHPGAMFYAVGKVVERQKGDKVYLNLRPRGWVVVEVAGEHVPSQELPGAPGRHKRARDRKQKLPIKD